MSYSTISINSANVTLVSSPTSPGLRSFEIEIYDAVSQIPQPFTGQIQVQQWPGGDLMSGTATLAPVKQEYADEWISFLMQLRGMSYAFQMGDPLKKAPRGTPSGTPQVDNTVGGSNAAMSTTLGTKGWTSSTSNLLLRGDYIQIGYRLHRVLDPVTSDGGGKASINIWPSLREQPADSSTIITSNTQGLWRLASNTRKYSFDTSKLTHMSFQFKEYR